MYYAKPIEGYEGSYEYHIKKCVDIFQTEVNRNREALSKIMDSLDYNMDTFERNTYLAVSMHDLGKLSYMFQNQMKKTIKKEKGIEYFRHELLSFAYMILATQMYLKENLNEFHYHYYAVLSHHKRLDLNLKEFYRERDKLTTWPELTEEEYKYAVNLSVKLSKEKLNLIDNLGNYKLRKETILKFFESRLTESSLVSSEVNRHNARILYSLCKGLLQYCDWIASSDKEPLLQTLTQDELVNKIKLKVESDGNKYSERKFHRDCSMATSDVIAIAPTGSGKTEASLLWAVKRVNSKIIFFMPTMVTSNSIFERVAKSYFKSEHCGLAHSNSEVYFAINDESKTKNSPELRFELLQYRAFIPPVMVSTIDQLLTSGFNIGHWALKEYSLVGSSIIFDEIQAYDTFTLGLITELIKKIKRLQGRVMIMSATMPNFLLNHFSKLLSIESPIVATELMNRKHNKWRFIDKQLWDIIEEIKKYIDEDKKVAVIVNSIETAKKLYIEMSKNYRALCLHSEFTMKDRIEKEKTLEGDNDYEVVISTQVMEVSLDISFNIMFSECAPIDSLVQRAGRCNRRSNYYDSEFIVFNYSEISERYVYRRYENVLKISKEVVQKNQKYLSEYEISEMVNEVYKDYNLYDENYNDAIRLYERIENEEMIFDLGYDEDKLKTRLIDNTKISIIPYKYKDEVENLFENKEYAKIALYEVPVSIGRYKKYILRNYCENNYNLPIYTIEYNSDSGVLYNDNTIEFL